MSFKDDILEAVQDADIEAVVLTGWPALNEKDDRAHPELFGKKLSWAEAAPVLDYDYDSGFGWQDCHNLLVYTHLRVYFVNEYDGSTSLRSVPRNPA